MKKIILIVNLIAITIGCQAQNNTINSTDLTINGIHYFGNDVALVIQNFGQPNTIEDYYYEMQDVMSKKYIYTGILFYIVNNKVDSFEISSNNYSFTTHNIKIGNNIETLQTVYPLSYANKRNSGMMLPFDDMDLFIVISYSNNLISKIALHSY